MLEATNAHQITLLNGKITKIMILSKNLQIDYTLTITKMHIYEVRRGESVQLPILWSVMKSSATNYC